MKVHYLEEGQYYKISNYAVARNPIFMSSEIQDHFRNKMELYLSPICEISAFRFRDNSFHIILRMKEREFFEELFKLKNGDPYVLNPIPESTYIFSQQMANLQVSLVKKINWLYDRKGGLMAGRFEREILETPEEVVAAILEVEEGSGVRKHKGEWRNKMSLDVGQIKGGWAIEYYRMYEKMGFTGIENQLFRDLEGHLKKPILPKLYSMEQYHNLQVLKYYHRTLE